MRKDGSKQVIDVEGTGSSWQCSKCNEAVSKEMVDQVRHYPNPPLKMHTGEKLNEAVSNKKIYKMKHHPNSPSVMKEILLILILLIITTITSMAIDTKGGRDDWVVGQ